MREDITSIPVSEVFEPRDGCPICRMRDMLEDRIVDYIVGAAKMEPDVRTETNRLGFCYEHFCAMMKKQKRLGVALILESHLAEVDRRVFEGLPVLGKTAKKQAEAASTAAENCFVCEKINWSMERMLSTVCRLWERESDFRRLFDEQAALCLPHFSLLVDTAERRMDKKTAPEFTKAASRLCRAYLTGLRADVSHFCEMFDYRNSGEGADWGDSRDAIERAVQWLTARSPR